MDMYRITRTDPKGSYRHAPGSPEVRYGTRKRAAAIVRQVREDNTSRDRMAKYYQTPYLPVGVKVERAPVGEFTDVTAEFMGDGE